MKLDLVSGLSRSMAKTNLFLSQNSPQILVIGGVLGVVASGVMACVATLKAKEVVDQAKEEVALIQDNLDARSEEEVKKDVIHTNLAAGRDLAFLYLPSVSLGVLSVVAILCGHNVMTKRNAALAAAYSAVDGAFKSYRARVAERYGEEAERNLRYNLREETIEETVIDEKGKEKKVKKKVKIADLHAASEYADYFMPFDPETGLGSRLWSQDMHLNYFNITSIMNTHNDYLNIYGRVFLNDLKRELGLPLTVAGQAVGWLKDNSPDQVGDNRVLISIEEVYVRNSRDELVQALLLDYNVDGNIIDRAAAKGLLAV